MVAALVVPTATALVGGCDETTGTDGFEDKDGVNDVPSPSKTDSTGPGFGGAGEGGGTTTGAPCIEPADCDDDDPCTNEDCVDEACVQTSKADDDNLCTEDTCDETGAVSHTPINAADTDPCTFDVCDPAEGVSHPTALPIFSEDFTDEQGWNVGTGWSIGPAAASADALNGGNDPGEDVSQSGDDIAGTVIGGLVTETTIGLLESPPIDVQTLAENEPVTLRYSRWLNTESSPEMIAAVLVGCGAADTPIWTSNGAVLDAPPTGTGWFQVRHDITAQANTCRAAAQPLRIGFALTHNGQATPDSGGWNIDEVQVVRVKVPADGDICTEDVCQPSQADPPVAEASHPTIFVDCDPLTGPKANP